MGVDIFNQLQQSCKEYIPGIEPLHTVVLCWQLANTVHYIICELQKSCDGKLTRQTKFFTQLPLKSHHTQLALAIIFTSNPVNCNIGLQALLLQVHSSSRGFFVAFNTKTVQWGCSMGSVIMRNYLDTVESEVVRVWMQQLTDGQTTVLLHIASVC